jgi:hypothetical protein
VGGWVGGRRYFSCKRDRKAGGLLKKEGRSFVEGTARCESVRFRAQVLGVEPKVG